MNLQQAMLNVASKIPIADHQVQKRLDRAYDICISSGYTLTKSIGISTSVLNCTMCAAVVERETQRCREHPLAAVGETVRTVYKWHVHKASTAAIATGEDSSAMYTVDADGCTCPDAMTARAGLCKHKLATMLIQEMDGDK